MTLVRLVNLLVVAVLVLAAVYVYDIKFEGAVRAAQVAKLREDIRREHDLIAALRAEWSQLDNPSRIQRIAVRYLTLRQVDATQFDVFSHVPLRRPEGGASDTDPIASIIESTPSELSTGSISVPAKTK